MLSVPHVAPELPRGFPQVLGSCLLLPIHWLRLAGQLVLLGIKLAYPKS